MPRSTGYRVSGDLSRATCAWAGVLSDGHYHTITIGVLGNRGDWPVDANLLLWLDPKSTQTGGKITHDDFQPAQVFQEPIHCP